MIYFYNTVLFNKSFEREFWLNLQYLEYYDWRFRTRKLVFPRKWQRIILAGVYIVHPMELKMIEVYLFYASEGIYFSNHWNYLSLTFKKIVSSACPYLLYWCLHDLFSEDDQPTSRHKGKIPLVDNSETGHLGEYFKLSRG